MAEMEKMRSRRVAITKQQLIEFENVIVNRYKNKEIRSPIHLSGGNEKQLIKIFKDIKDDDWIFTTYRSHYHCLLKGVPRGWLLKWISDNKSIHVMNAEYRIVTSAIVGGTLSQAVGCAMAIKRKYHNKDKSIKQQGYFVPHVWAFCGDMTYETGVFHECHKYAVRQDLPITFVIEDNGLSTDTPTQKVWGEEGRMWYNEAKIISYKYKRVWPHYGTGERINF